MGKIARTYTIKFSKGGIAQYADFKYDSDNKLIHNTFHPSWCDSSEVPIIKGIHNIDEILGMIKEFAYNNRAEIFLVNYAPTFMLDKEAEKDFVKETDIKLNKFYVSEITKYYKKFLKPIIIKNKWSLGKSGVGYYVLIKEYSVDKYGDALEKPEWDNVRDYSEIFEFEYLCQEMMVSLGLKERKSLRGEQGSAQIFVSNYLFQYLDILENEKFFVKVW